MQKYLPFIMYYGSELLLFTHKLHCLQTFWQITARWIIGPYFCTKYKAYTSYSFWDTRIQTEEQERQQQRQELEK